jgi:predicted P-loop ATPase
MPTYNINEHTSVLTPTKGSKTKYHCPVCNGHNLDIKPSTGEYNCFSGGCDLKDIRAAIDKLEGKPEWKPDREEWVKPTRPKSVKEYFYPDRNGNPLVKVVRIDPGDGSKKKFSQYHWNADRGWVTGNPDETKKLIPIYRHAEVRAAVERGELVFVVEGESTVDMLWALGIAATTTIGGAGKLIRYGEYSADFSGGKFIIAPDRDAIGVSHANDVRKLLSDRVEGYYLAGTQGLWRDPQGGMDIGDDICDWGLSKGQILDKVISLSEYDNIKQPEKLVAGRNDQKKDYIALAQAMGFELDGLNDCNEPISKMQKLKLDIFARKGNSIKFNVMTREIEMDGKPLDLNLAKDIGSMIVGYDASTDSFIQALMAVANLNHYHPVKVYLESLREVEENNDILNNLATLILGNNDPLANLMMRRKVIGAVARIYQPGCKDDSLLILQGKQGFMKSTFMRVLAGDDWFCDDIRDVENKDELAKLSRHWFLELAEVDYLFGKKEVELFKRFLSTQSDMYRPPYGRANVRVERTCSFWASTNKQEFLSDPTGSRRYWVVEVKNRIDVAAVKQVRDTIWATALAAYDAGEIWHLTPEEDISLAQANNVWADDGDPWDDIISAKMSEHLTQQGSIEWIDTGIIMDKILGIPIDRQDKRQRNRIGAMLQGAGFERRPIRIGTLLKKVWVREVLPNIGEEKMGNNLGNSQNPCPATNIPMLPKLPIINVGITLAKKEEPFAQGENNSDTRKMGNRVTVGNNTGQNVTGKHSQPVTHVVTRLENMGNKVKIDELGNKNELPYRLKDKVEYAGIDKGLQMQYAGILEIFEMNSNAVTCLKPDGRLTSWLDFSDLKFAAPLKN